MQGLDELKAALETARRLNNVDLQRLLLAVQERYLALVEESQAQKARLHELEEQARTKSEIVYEDPFYWQKQADGTKNGPFCSACWDSKGKLIRIPTVPGYVPRCPVCQAAHRR